jgi:hypothetical protein
LIDTIAKFFTNLIILFLVFTFGLYAERIPAIKSFSKYIASGQASFKEAIHFTPNIDGNMKVWFDKKEETHDGLILLTYHFRENPAVVLVDRDGSLVHSWNFSKEITNFDILEKDTIPFNINNSYQSVEDAHLLANGDLIASQTILELENYRGQRLVRIDKDSNVLWQINDNFHHDIFLDKNQNIYSLTSAIITDFPVIDFTTDDANIKFLDDIINVTSPDGKMLAQYSVTEGFANSEYSYFISMFDLNLPHQTFLIKDNIKIYDILHTNHVQHISAELAANNDLFEDGDLLISMRGINAIAIYRPREEKIVWASRGPWQHQHYVRLREDGRIYLYDNSGGNKVVDEGTQKDSRILAYDTNTQETEIIYYNPNHYYSTSFWRGYYHELDKGGYIINSPATGRVIQINKDKEVVWELRTIADREVAYTPFNKKITSTKFYKKNYLKSFLDN